jgi:putative oxidoreductase
MNTMTMTATINRSTVRSRIADVVGRLERFPHAVQQLLLRLAVGSVFLKAGLTKIASWDTTVALFRDEYQVPVLPPEIAAAMGTTFELGCSTLLIFGLATRLATLPLLGMLTVIQLFVYPNAWADHLTWGSILVAILTRGAGTASIDRLLGLEPSA